ncbi:MAG: MBL fold metallo-hydrolase [Porticoccaceae bacterium]
MELAGILVTHQHPDHIGSITELLNRHDIPQYGPADINLVSHPLGNGDKLWLADVDFSVLAVPGHT